MVAELAMSNEELEYDIVKEAVQGGGGKPNENKEDHHHMHKDRADLSKLRHIIQVQEDSIRELEREIIEIKKLVHDKRILETSNDMAPSPTATPAVATPATAAATTTLATATPAAAAGNPAPSTRTKIKTVVKRKFVKSSKLVHPFTTYPKKRRRSARIGARVVKSPKN